MYDEGEYGDTLKSWMVPTYMLCALNPLTAGAAYIRVSIFY